MSELERLLHKYRTLAALRQRREEVAAAGHGRFEPREGARRRVIFRELAAEFPGALRELDTTPATELAARAAEVERAIAAGRAERWMEVQLAYHATLREVLAVKRFLSERLPRGGPIDDALLAELRAWHAAWPHRHGELPEGDLRAYLERHLRPPGGRVHALVMAALEDRFGSSAAELQAQLHPFVAPQLRHL